MFRSRVRLVLAVSAVLAVASCGVEAGDVRTASVAGGDGGGQVTAPVDGTSDGEAEQDPPGGSDDDEAPGPGGAGSRRDPGADPDRGGDDDRHDDEDRPDDEDRSDDEDRPGDEDRSEDDDRSGEPSDDTGPADGDTHEDGPQRYGDDADLDSLQDDCRTGDDRACDLLYLTSPVGSGYEAVGETCGGRSPSADRYCAPETVLTDDGFSSADNPGLAVLERDCLGGDLTACDLLYQISPIGSAEEETGHTCGGSVPTGAYPSCRSHFEPYTV